MKTWKTLVVLNAVLVASISAGLGSARTVTPSIVSTDTEGRVRIVNGSEAPVRVRTTTLGATSAGFEVVVPAGTSTDVEILADESMPVASLLTVDSDKLDVSVRRGHKSSMDP